MSTEANQSRKVDVGQPNATEVKRLVLNDQEVKEIKKGWSTREKAMGTVLILGALAGGATAANHFSQSESSEATDENPNVTGPLVAGEVTAEPNVGPTGETPAEPTPDSTEVMNQLPIYNGEEMSRTNYPYQLNGEVFETQEAMSEALSLKVEDYPTVKDALPAMAQQLENWFNAGLTESEYEASLNYQTTDGLKTGLYAVAHDMYDSVYNSTLLHSEESETSALEWRDEMKLKHNEQIQKWIETRTSETPALATVTFEGSGMFSETGTDVSDPNYSVYEIVTFKIDDGIEGSTPQEITFMPKFVIDQNGDWSIVEVEEATILN